MRDKNEENETNNDVLVIDGEEYIVWAVGNGQLHQSNLQRKVGALNAMHDQQIVLMIKNTL